MAPATMRAARLYGPGLPLRLEDVPLPTPGPGEALLRVRAAGVCHTELHMLDGVLNLGVVPLIPGHEVVGEVVNAPAGSGPGLGQRVLLYYYAPCARCAHCQAGQENLCPNVARQFGFTADGGYAEFLSAPLSCLLPLPDELSDAAAVGLACAGATALHAARAVAQVRAGETVVVYGIGGVGLYLVQLCRLAGAQVIAVGRTPEKLALASDLGAAHTVNARDGDALEAVQAHSAGEGADVVFDLVASAETMAVAPRMLARRGRLVFAGYGADRLQISPLWLVLRELQVRGAVGNTRAELRQTLDLAASGQLRSIAGPSYPLERVNEALANLRAGRLVGRALLLPGTGGPPLPPNTVGSSSTSPNAGARLSPQHSAASGATQRSVGGPCPQPRAAERAAPKPGEAERAIRQPREAERPSPQNWGAGGARPFERELLEVMAQGIDGPLAGDDAAFNQLALGLFRYQFERNVPYHRYCAYRGRTPDRVSHWTEIPAVPIGAFKETVLATEPPEEAVALFMSSGTTRPDLRSRHFHPDLRVYDASARANFAAHLLPDGIRLPMLVLNPPPAILPNSSLAHYLGLMVDAYGASGSAFFVDEAGLRDEPLLTALRAAETDEAPVCLLGATFAFVHLLDRLVAGGVRLALPAGSRIMDTGGVKGRSREISREALEGALLERLGVPPDHQVNMYGLTELSTQFLDTALRLALAGQPFQARAKSVPAWARTRVLDPERLEVLPAGEVGLLCHTDLANRASVCTVLTEDLGVARGAGFEVLGRVQGSQARGCSIALDELLTATGGRQP